jgi:hypothetical protein
VSGTERNRMVACRACGNRVPRSARRCPACGTRDPVADSVTAPVPDPAAVPKPAPPVAVPDAGGPPVVKAPASPAPRAASSVPKKPEASGRPARRSVQLARLLLMALGIAAVVVAGGAVAYLVRPPLAPPMESRTETPAAPPSAPAMVAREPGPSRSRGRTDWLFYFKPGDWLTRMANDAILGVVVRLENVHRFPDGTTGPAYVIQTMEGDERTVDADELERTSKIQ